MESNFPILKTLEPISCMVALLMLSPSAIGEHLRADYREFLKATLEYVKLTRLQGRSHSAEEECFILIDAIVADCELYLIRNSGFTGK